MILTSIYFLCKKLLLDAGHGSALKGGTGVFQRFVSGPLIRGADRDAEGANGLLLLGHSEP